MMSNITIGRSVYELYILYEKQRCKYFEFPPAWSVKYPKNQQNLEVIDAFQEC